MIVKVVHLTEFERAKLKQLNDAFDQAERDLRNYESNLRRAYMPAASAYGGFLVDYKTEFTDNEFLVYTR